MGKEMGRELNVSLVLLMFLMPLRLGNRESVRGTCLQLRPRLPHHLTGTKLNPTSERVSSDGSDKKSTVYRSSSSSSPFSPANLILILRALPLTGSVEGSELKGKREVAFCIDRSSVRGRKLCAVRLLPMSLCALAS